MVNKTFGKILGNPKNVFWEALFLTVVIFVFGLLLGVAFEGSRLDRVNEYYAKSEISLMDVLALNSLIDLGDADCKELILANIKFADRVYEEASLLEKYDGFGKITSNLKLAHQKYDLLRTFLWINSLKTIEKCEEDFSFIVYLYEYKSEDLTRRATQDVWANILFDLKKEKGDEIILIPIAVNSNLTSLNSLIEKFEISEFPTVIINNKYIVKELSSIEDIKKYIN